MNLNFSFQFSFCICPLDQNKTDWIFIWERKICFLACHTVVCLSSIIYHLLSWPLWNTLKGGAAIYFLTICWILWKLFPWKLKACSKRTLSSTVHSSGKGVKFGRSARDFSMLCLCQNNMPSAFKKEPKRYKFHGVPYWPFTFLS